MYPYCVMFSSTRHIFNTHFLYTYIILDYDKIMEREREREREKA